MIHISFMKYSLSVSELGMSENHVRGLYAYPETKHSFHIKQFRTSEKTNYGFVR